jgi:hypothetical protein
LLSRSRHELLGNFFPELSATGDSPGCHSERSEESRQMDR